MVLDFIMQSFSQFFYSFGGILSTGKHTFHTAKKVAPPRWRRDGEGKKKMNDEASSQSSKGGNDRLEFY